MLYKQFYMTGIAFWALGYYLFHSCFGNYHSVLLPVHSYLFSMFGTGAGTSSEIPRNIIIYL